MKKNSAGSFRYLNILLGLFCLSLLTSLMGSLSGCQTTSAAALNAEDSSSASSANMIPAELQQRVKLRMELALAYYRQGAYPVALEEVNQVLKLDPGSSEAYGLRALVYMELKEFKLAQNSFVAGLKIQSDDPDLNNNYGWFLCQQGTPAQALPYFETAFKNPAYPMQNVALTNAGRCNLALNRVDVAEKYLRQALVLDPNHPMTNLYLAKIAYQRNQINQAKIYIDRVIVKDQLSADTLWLALRIEHRLGNSMTEATLASQLKRRFTDSREYAAYQRGAFNE